MKRIAFLSALSLVAAFVVISGCTSAGLDFAHAADFTDIAPEYSSYYRNASAPVFAYTLYDQYNVGEDIVYGIKDDHAGPVSLRAPVTKKIEKLEGGQWTAVYAVSADQDIKLENGSRQEGIWDQRSSDGRTAGYGDYRVSIDNYTATFSIMKEVPAVIVMPLSDNGSIPVEGLMNTPQQKAFGETYKKGTYSIALRDRMVKQMLFKAYMKGEDPKTLWAALNATDMFSSRLEMLPCLAIHGSYKGSPAWAIAFNWGMGGEDLMHVRYYIVDDATGTVVAFLTCK